MHAVNPDRQRGRGGRGKFGTGKSAAFGIAHKLRVETRRAVQRNVVELTRAAIDETTGNNIPVDWIVKNEPTDEPNGTVVTISDIKIRRLDRQRVVDYIERHLQAFRAIKPEVAVNDHVCTYVEPESTEDPRKFRPTEQQQKILGDIELVVKISKAPLNDSEIGIIVTAGQGNTVAIETGAIARKSLATICSGLSTHRDWTQRSTVLTRSMSLAGFD